MRIGTDSLQFEERINRKMSKHNLYTIDNTTSKNTDFHLVTHAHLDHFSTISKHTHALIASHKTIDFIQEMDKKPPQTCALVGVTLYDRIKLSKHISFVAFPTKHSPGSIGYFFVETGILHLGDGRITRELILDVRRFDQYSIRTIVVDTLLYDSPSFTVPPYYQTVATFSRLVQILERKLNRKVRVRILSSSLLCLLKDANIGYKIPTRGVNVHKNIHIWNKLSTKEEKKRRKNNLGSVSW